MIQGENYTNHCLTITLCNALLEYTTGKMWKNIILIPYVLIKHNDVIHFILLIENQ